MTLVKFNPVRDLIDFEREFNKMFNSLENRFGISKSKDTDAEYENAVWMPLTDIYENKDNFSLKIDLPGIKKEDVKIFNSLPLQSDYCVAWKSGMSMSKKIATFSEPSDLKMFFKRTFPKLYNILRLLLKKSDFIQ